MWASVLLLCVLAAATTTSPAVTTTSVPPTSPPTTAGGGQLTTAPEIVKCSSRDHCVKKPGGKCTIRSGFVTLQSNTEPTYSCAAPMTCLRDWTTEDEGVCVLESEGMPCLMNNFLGGCGTLSMTPNAYCREGMCRRPPSFPGDHCYVDSECTSGARCVKNVCVGVAEGGLCTNQYRLCDRGLYCPTAPPGHAKCRKQVPVGGTCQVETSLVQFLTAMAGVNECVPGAHCLHNVCVSNDSIRGKLGQPCTGHVMAGHLERLCEDELFCHPRNHTCQRWPDRLWWACRSDAECGDGMVCNCKVGGVQVCEVAGQEGIALYERADAASREVVQCIARHNCWRGRSAYPKNVFNAHACAWMHCRHAMAAEMHRVYCSDHSLPGHRGCIMDDWCQNLLSWNATTVAAPPKATPSPDQMVQRLTPAEIIGIVLGSLALTLLVFFSGFIVGWVRRKYVSWRMSGAGGDGGSGDAVEFSNLDSLVANTEEI